MLNRIGNLIRGFLAKEEHTKAAGRVGVGMGSLCLTNVTLKESETYCMSEAHAEYIALKGVALEERSQQLLLLPAIGA